MEQVLAFLKPLVEMYAGSFGIAVQIVSIVGTIRLFLKPILDFVKAIAGLTPTLKDDEFLAKVESSVAWKSFFYLTDWLLSLKFLPKA